MAESDFQEVFSELKTVLARYEEELVKVKDDDRNYYLDSAHVLRNKRPLFFGAVQVGKRYVSYHLMPVYVQPDLLETASPELRERMQGKSCFNFTRVDPQLIEELERLTRAGFEFYRDKGYLQ